MTSLTTPPLLSNLTPPISTSTVNSGFSLNTSSRSFIHRQSLSQSAIARSVRAVTTFQFHDFLFLLNFNCGSYSYSCLAVMKQCKPVLQLDHHSQAMQPVVSHTTTPLLLMPCANYKTFQPVTRIILLIAISGVLTNIKLCFLVQTSSLSVAVYLKWSTCTAAYMPSIS